MKPWENWCDEDGNFRHHNKPSNNLEGKRPET